MFGLIAKLFGKTAEPVTITSMETVVIDGAVLDLAQEIKKVAPWKQLSDCVDEAQRRVQLRETQQRNDALWGGRWRD